MAVGTETLIEDENEIVTDHIRAVQSFLLDCHNAGVLINIRKSKLFALTRSGQTVNYLGYSLDFFNSIRPSEKNLQALDNLQLTGSLKNFQKESI